MKLIEKDPTNPLTLDVMLKERFGIDPNDHLLGLSKFMDFLKDNPWVMEETDDNADIFANKLLDCLDLSFEELEAASAFRKQYDKNRLH